VLPYVCIDLSLDEQLIHLSTAAHLIFYLYRYNAVGTSFMPVQSYTDIIIMTKNAFFCVAKTKVDMHSLMSPPGTVSLPKSLSRARRHPRPRCSAIGWHIRLVVPQQTA
jgi:hypothetical protein